MEIASDCCCISRIKALNTLFLDIFKTEIDLNLYYRWLIVKVIFDLYSALKINLSLSR